MVRPCKLPVLRSWVAEDLLTANVIVPADVSSNAKVLMLRGKTMNDCIDDDKVQARKTIVRIPRPPRHCLVTC